MRAKQPSRYEGGDSSALAATHATIEALSSDEPWEVRWRAAANALHALAPHDAAHLIDRTGDTQLVASTDERTWTNVRRQVESALDVVDAAPVRAVSLGPGRTILLAAAGADPRAVIALVGASATDATLAALALVAAAARAVLARDRALALAKRVARDRDRDASLETFAELLRALSGALDIRQVFPRVSEIAGQVLAHDRLTMTFHDADGTFAVEAMSNDDGPMAVQSWTDPARLADGTARVVHDLGQHWVTLTDYRREVLDSGYRSLLAVLLTAREQGFGLQFWSKRLGAFHEDQIPVARRIAEHVALAVSHEQLAETARVAAEARARATRLEARVQALSDQLDTRTGYRRMVGRSSAWQAVCEAAAQVAGTDATVLLTGESGTGKEVVARYVHRASRRANGPFIAVNCAALPEHLLESELFGYERGAFTGADRTKPGQIELAARGVLFLDEVAEMSLSAQAKFLRVLQEREFQRLGGTRTLRADVRVVAATNRNLRRAMERGDFREDLFYRLQVFDIRLPALRERTDDIPLLAAAFLDEIGPTLGRPPAGMTQDARRALVGYQWPGNVRELRNVLERAAILCEGGLIAPEHLSLGGEGRGEAAVTDLRAFERRAVELALEETRGNRTAAARRLGLSRKQLYVRLRRYGIGKD